MGRLSSWCGLLIAIIESKMHQSIVIGFNTQGCRKFYFVHFAFYKVLGLLKISRFEVDLTNHSVIEDLRAYITTLEQFVFSFSSEFQNRKGKIV